MTEPLVVDLETVATDAALAEPYPEAERHAPKNYVKLEAIQAWREADRAKWQAERAGTCALSPLLGRIVAIGYALPCADGPAFAVQLARLEAEEPALLRDFWTQVAVAVGRIVTWNGLGFDLRFAVVRSIVHGVEPSVPGRVVQSWFRRYATHPHFDVRAVLNNWDNRAEGTLTEWCRALGVEHENGVTGADVAGLYQAGEFTKIAAHCESDVRSTHALYRKVAGFFT